MARLEDVDMMQENIENDYRDHCLLNHQINCASFCAWDSRNPIVVQRSRFWAIGKPLSVESLWLIQWVSETRERFGAKDDIEAQ
ncbi:hypothetical protein EAF00_001577 [Botryotinia globosa]|nr:hypothetical protein EAF00_001577 [Botryotinia globosa]